MSSSVDTPGAAWDALVAESQGRLDADALLLFVPATWGQRTRDDGSPNPRFFQNRTEFTPLIQAVRKPTALFFFAEDPFDPGGRDAIAARHFKRHNVLNLLVSRPPAFKGHFSGILPVFDYMYGPCIESFIAEPTQGGACEPRDLESDDFRAVVRLEQLNSTKLAPTDPAASFNGRSFVAHTISGQIREITFASPKAARIRKSLETSQTVWTLKDGLLCLGKDCELIRRWDERRYLGFDPKSKNISSWWIEN